MKTLKKSMMALGLSTAIFFSANAQDISASKVPAVVKEAFSKANPGVKATWELEDGNYEAGYMSKGLENSFFYTPTGKMIKYETGINPALLPAAASAYLKKNYAGKKLEEAAKITTATGEISYLAVVNGSGKAKIFDAKGQFIETVKD